jgi:hypothetical protein
MMLRASIEHSGLADADINGIAGNGDSGLPHGAELIAFAEAAVSGDPVALPQARDRLSDTAGHDVMIDAAAIIANFEMMTRVADTTGAAVNERAADATAAARAAIDVDAFESARWG